MISLALTGVKPGNLRVLVSDKTHCGQDDACQRDHQTAQGNDQFTFKLGQGTFQIGSGNQFRTVLIKNMHHCLCLVLAETGGFQPAYSLQCICDNHLFTSMMISMVSMLELNSSHFIIMS